MNRYVVRSVATRPGAARRHSLSEWWESGEMKGSFGTLVRRPLIVATLTLSLLAATVSTVGATSVTTTTAPSGPRVDRDSHALPARSNSPGNC